MKTPTASIIFDIPTADDAFDGAGHRRSAKALAEGIDQVFENGGGAIGLEGAWGAGKSSVIRMAEANLEEVPSRKPEGSSKPAYHIFTFDLWTHQTDEFRRAFLERFIDFVDQGAFPHKVNVQLERDRVRNRKKQITNENRHQYTSAGAFIVLLLPFVPLVYAWLNPAAFVNLTSLNRVPLMVLVATVAAILISLVMIRHHYLRLPADERKHEKTFLAKFVRGASEFLTISKNVKSEVSTQWIRDEDPTTVEFQKTFRNILEGAQSDSERLVFVLDNVDRLSPEGVKNAWSEMRALLTGQHDPFANGAAVRPVVVVVPYDREIVTKAILDKKEDGDLFAKTFNRILRVSPPLGSHWASFLDQALQSAFGSQIGPTEAYRLHRILQHHFQAKALQATPRRIIGFVNDLGAYWTQWGGTISAESMGVFVLLRHELEIQFSAKSVPEFEIDDYSKLANQPNILNDLAALHFNIDPEVAEEVLLLGPLSNALVASTPDGLVNLQRISGFRHFFPKLVSVGLENRLDDATALANAGQNIASLKLEGALAQDVSGQLADLLPKIVSISIEGTDADVSVRNGLIAIVGMQSGPALQRAAFALNQKLKEIVSTNGMEEFSNGFEWAKYSVGIAKLIGNTDLKLRKKFWKECFPGGSAEFALGAAYWIETDADLAYLDLGGLPALADVVTEMLARVKSDARVVRDSTREFLKSLTHDQKAAIINGIAAHLKGQEVDGTVAAYLLVTCEEISRSSFNADKLVAAASQALLEDGTVLFYGHRAFGEGRHIAVAAAMFLLIKQYRANLPQISVDPHPVLGSLEAPLDWYASQLKSPTLNDATVARLAEDVSKQSFFGIWLAQTIAEPTGNLFELVIWKMVELDALGAIGAVATSALIRHYEAISTRFSEEQLRSLISSMGKASINVELLEDDKLFGVPHDLVGRISEWASGTHLAKLIDRIDEKLRAIKADEWATLLDDEADATQMLISRVRTAQLSLNASSYLSGYKHNALAVLAEDVSVDTPAEKWNLLYSAVPQNSRKLLAQQVMIDMPRRGVKPSGAVEFVTYYPDLAAALPLLSYPEAAVQLFLRELVLSRSPEAKAYVTSQLGAFKKAVKKLLTAPSPSDALSAFIDVLDELEQGGDQSGKDWATQLRGGLGLTANMRGRKAK